MELVQRLGTEVFVSLKNFRTEIDGDIKNAIDRMADDRGMTIRAISEKVFAWLAQQEPEVQAVILGQIPSQPDFIELVLRRMAAQSTPSGSSGTETNRPPGKRFKLDAPASNPAEKANSHKR